MGHEMEPREVGGGVHAQWEVCLSSLPLPLPSHPPPARSRARSLSQINRSYKKKQKRPLKIEINRKAVLLLELSPCAAPSPLNFQPLLTEVPDLNPLVCASVKSD